MGAGVAVRAAAGLGVGTAVAVGTLVGWGAKVAVGAVTGVAVDTEVAVGSVPHATSPKRNRALSNTKPRLGRLVPEGILVPVRKNCPPAPRYEHWVESARNG